MYYKVVIYLLFVLFSLTSCQKPYLVAEKVNLLANVEKFQNFYKNLDKDNLCYSNNISYKEIYSHYNDDLSNLVDINYTFNGDISFDPNLFKGITSKASEEYIKKKRSNLGPAVIEKYLIETNDNILEIKHILDDKEEKIIKEVSERNIDFKIDNILLKTDYFDELLLNDYPDEYIYDSFIFSISTNADDEYNKYITIDRRKEANDRNILQNYIYFFNEEDKLITISIDEVQAATDFTVKRNVLLTFN